LNTRHAKTLAAALIALAAGAAPATPQFEVNPAGMRKAQYMEALMFGSGHVGGPFALTDQSGARRTLDDFRGRLVLLYFGYTFCPDVCPTDLVTLKAVLELHADDVQVVFVTLDPERDTPAQLAAYLPYFDPRIVGLTGTAEEVRSVAERYKAYYAKVPVKGSDTYMIDHSAGIYLLDREGRFRGLFPAGASVELMAGVVKEFL
jgi:cytochrome oxidase Cu insertion factor (SCO1/SenC/PrrC family)